MKVITYGLRKMRMKFRMGTLLFSQIRLLFCDNSLYMYHTCIPPERSFPQCILLLFSIGQISLLIYLLNLTPGGPFLIGSLYRTRYILQCGNFHRILTLDRGVPPPFIERFAHFVPFLPDPAGTSTFLCIFTC
jgi:hypothetical protein